jgi:nucleotide-binding universal stress UspA family protein
MSKQIFLIILDSNRHLTTHYFSLTIIKSILKLLNRHYDFSYYYSYCSKELDSQKERIMYKKILYLTAFEKFSLDILACTLDFKKLGTEEIVLVHVIAATLPRSQENVFLDLENELRIFLSTKMEEAVRLIEDAGLKAKTRIETGEPYLEILRAAEEENASLIISGRERKGIPGEIYMGSTTDKIIRYGAIPVYIHKYPGVVGADKDTCERYRQRLFSRILYPTDWSDCAREALRYVESFKEAGVEEVIVAHIMDEKAMKLHTAERFKEFKRIDLEKLVQIKDELEREGFRVKIHLSLGNPRADLIKVASKEDVSLIVLCSHGKGHVEGILWGSVSRNVTEYSDRTVLLVRGEKEKIS